VIIPNTKNAIPPKIFINLDEILFFRIIPAKIAIKVQIK
jgi:hypothetical protein